MLRLSCPSCNTAFTLPELPPGRRATCPRCGDMFPVRGAGEETGDRGQETDAPAPIAASPATYAPTRRAAGRWSVQRTLAVGLGMGLLGLLAGLGVYFARGGFRPKPTPEPEPPPAAAATPPTQLAGLGYLPADTTVAFAVQPGPFLAYASRTNQNPRDLLTKAGVPAQVLDALARVGLTLPQIDHLAAGTPADELRFTLALVLRRPLADEDAFLGKLKARRQPGGKDRYEADFGGARLALARVSPTVWVLGFDAKKDLAAADRGGYGPGGTQFPTGLTQMIAERVPPTAAAWLATSDEAWAQKPAVDLLARLLGAKGLKALLAKGRAATAAFTLDDPPRVRVFVRAADEATGQQVRDYFRRQAAGDDRITHGGAGEVAYFDTPADPANAFAVIRQMLADAVR